MMSIFMLLRYSKDQDPEILNNRDKRRIYYAVLKLQYVLHYNKTKWTINVALLIVLHHVNTMIHSPTEHLA